jgi:glycosyltransferase involved in cell wall biosynthesis
MNDEVHLFVSCPFGGTEVFMKNLKLYVDSRRDVSAHWLEIPKPEPSASGGLDRILDNWTIRASRSASSEVRRLRREGRRIKAAFFNHLTAVSLLPFRNRIPCLLSLDITPVLLRQDTKWYGGEGIRTEGIAERLSRSWTRRTYAAMRYLLPWSHLAEGSLVNDYGMTTERVVVQPPGIDLSYWKPDQLLADRRDRRLSVLFVGGEFVRKGGDSLLEVAMNEAFREVDFHFVTASFSGPTPGNVHVHRGVLPNSKELLKLYQESDVFALPTRADYTPIAVIEALAVGLPVIATDVGGLSEMINEGKDGYIVPPNGVEALAHRLLQLKSNPVLLQDLKRNARKHAEENFDMMRMGSKIVDLLRIAGESSGRTHVQG